MIALKLSRMHDSLRVITIMMQLTIYYLSSFHTIEDDSCFSENYCYDDINDNS